MIHRAVLFLLFFTSAFADDKIHPHGYWVGEDAESHHVYDPLLGSALADFFLKERAHTIVDFGCGLGDYVKTLLSHQFQCEGYDGHPNTYALTGGVAKVLDLSQPFNLGKQFDWVLSLEVGEHLPKCYEEIFLENLCKHNSKGIVLSWALKGQGGFGHFNEQNNDYIKRVMKKLGYESDEEAEKILRERSSLSWFKNTVMVFRRPCG